MLVCVSFTYSGLSSQADLQKWVQNLKHRWLLVVWQQQNSKVQLWSCVFTIWHWEIERHTYKHTHTNKKRQTDTHVHKNKDKENGASTPTKHEKKIEKYPHIERERERQRLLFTENIITNKKQKQQQQHIITGTVIKTSPWIKTQNKLTKQPNNLSGINQIFHL